MELIGSSLNGSILTFKRRVPERYKFDLIKCLEAWKKHITHCLDNERAKLTHSFIGLKFQLSVRVRLLKLVYAENGEATQRIIDPFFTSECRRYNRHAEQLGYMLEELHGKFDSFIQLGSGYTMHEIDALFLKIFKYRLLRGGGGLCKDIIKKHACLSIACVDDRCLLYSCLATIYPRQRNAHRASYYAKYLHKLKTDGITYPVSLNQIPKFERMNRKISLNIFGYERGIIVLLYHTHKSVARYEINLLLYRDHYYPIRHLSRLLCKQSGVTRKYLFCHFCLNSYLTRAALNDHETLCRKKLQRLETPRSSQPSLTFHNYHSLFYLPFIIYYDIEALLKRDEINNRQIHRAISLCSITVCQHEEYTQPPRIFNGENCIQDFLAHLEMERQRIEHILRTTNERIRISAADRVRHKKTMQCDICHASLHNRRKCFDHDHLSTNTESNVRFITCSLCNLTYGSNRATKIPVVAHNSMAYDIHHIISSMNDASNVVRILAKNSERPLSLYLKGGLVFIDSLNFVPGSLDSLASQLPGDVLDTYLRWLTKGCARKRELLMRKAALPYDYLTDRNTLREDKLPPIQAFHNKLNDTPLDERDYHRAQTIWEEFECKCLGDYLEIYVTLDMLLLAAVFENFRASTYKHFRLDPGHYVSAPSLSFDAMLRITRVKIDLLSDLDMYLFFCKGIRGGMSGSSVRYAKANHQDMSDFDPQTNTSHLLSFDANNLYGHSLSQFLPISDFQWLTRDEIDALDISTHPKRDPFGYYLEVDLTYPQKLHDLHNDFPLAPEKFELCNEDLSQFAIGLMEKLKLKHMGTKLMSTLMDKRRYILHYEILKLYLRLGLQLTHIHRCIQFRQQDFMKEYIALNNRSHKKARNPFEVSLFKLYNNSIYGHCLYNIFRQVNVQLVSDPKKFQRLAAKPTFASTIRINECLVSLCMKPAVIVCNKPIFIGTSVLDLSKCHMYSFYYDHLMTMYSNRGLRLLYTDTNSFYIQVMNCSDVYRDILKYHQDVMIVISLLRLFTFTSLSCVCILSLRSFSCTPLNRILTIHCICLYWRGGSVQNTELAPDNSHLYNHTTGQPEAKWL